MHDNDNKQKTAKKQKINQRIKILIKLLKSPNNERTPNAEVKNDENEKHKISSSASMWMMDLGPFFFFQPNRLLDSIHHRTKYDDYYYNFVLVFAVCILFENNKFKMHILMGCSSRTIYQQTKPKYCQRNFFRSSPGYEWYATIYQKEESEEEKTFTQKAHNLVRKLQTQSTMMALARSFQLRTVYIVHYTYIHIIFCKMP